jgi:hypothetical protein
MHCWAQDIYYLYGKYRPNWRFCSSGPQGQRTRYPRLFPRSCFITVERSVCGPDGRERSKGYWAVVVLECSELVITDVADEAVLFRLHYAYKVTQDPGKDRCENQTYAM